MGILITVIVFSCIASIETDSNIRGARSLRSQHDSTNKHFYFIIPFGRYYLLLSNTRKLIYLPFKLRNFKTRIEKSSDFPKDYRRRQNVTNTSNLKDFRRLGITFKFRASGFSLNENLKQLIRTSTNFDPNQFRFAALEKDDSDVVCTLSIVDCISTCAKKYPSEEVKGPVMLAEKWQCVLDCGNICGTDASKDTVTETTTQTYNSSDNFYISISNETSPPSAQR